MKKNADVIAVMFEEVSNLLKTVDKRINDQHQKLDDVATKADVSRDKAAIENAFLQTSRNLSVVDQKLNRISASVRDSEYQIRSGLESISSILNEQEKERLARDSQMLKLKSKRMVMAFVFLFLLFSVSLIGNVYHRKEMKRMSDNDIKYRYIKMTGGIDANNLSKLEDVFLYRKDEKWIEEIRRKVDEHENNKR